MLFFSFSNINIQFIETEIIQKKYTITKDLSTTQSVIFINKIKFAAIISDMNSNTYIVYMTTLNTEISNIYYFWAAQIGLLKVNKALTTISTQYLDYNKYFSFKLAAKL